MGEQVPILPIKTTVTYLGEGAANIVYRISVPYPTPPPSQVEEYGEGTPPPSDIEIQEIDGQPITASDLKIFDRKLNDVFEREHGASLTEVSFRSISI